MEYILRKNRIGRIGNVAIIEESIDADFMIDILFQHEEQFNALSKGYLEFLCDVDVEELKEEILNFPYTLSTDHDSTLANIEFLHQIVMECYAELVDIWKKEDDDMYPRDLPYCDGIDMESAPNYTWA